jgi:hypothetical protein
VINVTLCNRLHRYLSFAEMRVNTYSRPIVIGSHGDVSAVVQS